MKYLPYLLIALVIGAFIYQNHQITSLSEALGTANQKVEQLITNQKKIKTDIDNFKRDQKDYDGRIQDLESKNRSNKTNLDKLKGRENTVLAKPELIEKKINESFKKSADSLSCSTGASERCVK